MREIQSNNGYFLYSSVSGNSGDEVNESKNLNAQSITSTSRDGKKVLLSSQIILRSLTPLFVYYRQLFASANYKDMIVTIIDRHIRGWSSSARETVENLTFRMKSSDRSLFDPVLELLKSNHIYHSYKTVNLALSLLSGSSSSSAKLTAASNPTSLDLPKALLQLKNWSKIWEMNSKSTYPVSGDCISRDFLVFTNVGAIINSCEWLCMQLQIMTVNIIRQSNSNKLSPFKFFMKNQSTESKRTTMKRTTSIKIDTTDNGFVTMVQGCMNSLLKLTDECYGLLITEVQLVCFHYLHQLSHLKSHEIKSKSQNLTLHETKFNPDDFVEAESIIMAWNHHMALLLDSLQASLPYNSIKVIFISLPVLVPRIIMTCINSILISRASSSIHIGDSKATNNFEKARLLKVIVSCQQCISLLFDTYIFAQRSIKKGNNSFEIMEYFDETQSEEFERLRKYVSMMDLSMQEFKFFLKNNVSLFSQAEYKALWIYISYKSEDIFDTGGVMDDQFDQLWQILLEQDDRQ
jgi:hypothetical protein